MLIKICYTYIEVSFKEVRSCIYRNRERCILKASIFYPRQAAQFAP